MMPVMYRKADELEEPDEDSVDHGSTCTCLHQVPHIPSTPTRTGVHGEGTQLGTRLHPQRDVLLA